MVGERRERISRILTLTLLALLLALTLSILLVMNALPRLAAREFGAASLSLNAVQKLNYSVQLFLNRSDLLLPLDTGGVPHPFRIEPNESINSIVARLEREGIIRDAAAIRIYLIYSGGDTQIQAGEFQLNPAMNGVEIAEVLKDASLTHGKLRILAGWRLEEIAAALPTSGFQITEEEFLRLAANPAAFRLPQGVNGVSSLEGFLYPDVYVLDRAIGAEELIQTMLNRFEASLTPELMAALERQGLDLRQGVILASIIEREAVVDDELPRIASVFHNRFQIGMKLDSDPTVQYAVGYNPRQNTWWTNPLSFSDLAFDSDFNTYLRVGLPPGPICNPGAESLQAVAFPTQTPYYYFRARCDGSGRHLFAVTYAEHVQNACP